MNMLDSRDGSTTAVRSEAVKFGPMQVDWETRVDFAKLRSDRLARTRAAMERFDLDFLLSIRMENGRYISGVKRLYWPTLTLAGGPVIMLPREGELSIGVIDTDMQSKALTWIPSDRFRAPRRMEVDHEVVTYAKELRELFGNALDKARIGVDLWTPAMYKVLPKEFPNATFVDGQEAMLSARSIKTPEELSCIKMAYAIAEAGMYDAVQALRPGIRECELVGIAFNKFWQLGAETSQCSHALNSGPGSEPYRRFHTDRIIQYGEMVNIDLGACWNGYFSDYCRPFVCGKKPSKAQLDLLKRAYEAQIEGLNAVKPGYTAAEICKKLGRKMLGHSIGMGPLDPPMLHSTWDAMLQPGMTFSVYTPHMGEPGVGGVHIEDEVIVTETGCEVYSTFPYLGIDD
jgi:Xaa-Pro aminopeptidase